MSAEIIQCIRCNRIFSYIPGQPKYCNKCKEEIDKIIVKVKEYIRENKNCSVSEISELFDISTKTIFRWVREEILEFTEGSNIKICCENCNKLITTGKLCAECKRDCINSLKKSITVPKITESKDSSSKMRFLDNNRNK